MSIGSDVGYGASVLLDPANIFGTRGQQGQGSTIDKVQGNPWETTMPGGEVWNGTDWVMPPKDKTAFMQNIAPEEWKTGSAFAQKATGYVDPKLIAPPPPQWAYVNGQGPVWQTPDKRIDTHNNWSMTNNAPGTPGFYGGVNRI